VPPWPGGSSAAWPAARRRPSPPTTNCWRRWMSPAASACARWRGTWRTTISAAPARRCARWPRNWACKAEGRNDMPEEKPRLLIVDDVPSNLDVLREVLGGRYVLQLATSGGRALELAQAAAPDLVLLDIMMPGMDGYAVCRRLKAQEATRRVPVIFVTAMQEIEDEARGFECGCVDYIIKPVSPPLVLARIDAHLKLYRQEQHLHALVRERTAEVEKTRLELIRRLGRAAEYKDDESGLHVIRMSHYARLLALAAGMGEEQAETVFLAAPLHDI